MRLPAPCLLFFLIMVVMERRLGLTDAMKAAETPTNATSADWYVDDHPFMYVMEKVRVPNGSWVPNPNFSLPPLTMDEFFGNVSTRLPWFVRLYARANTKKLRQAQTDARKAYWYNFVSPMDWGRSARAEFHRREYRQMMAHFWFDMLGKFAVSRAVQNVYELVVGGWQRQVAGAAFYKNFVTMPLDEFAATVNMTMEDVAALREIAAERAHKNFTMPYELKTPLFLSERVREDSAEKKRAFEYFQPYPNYTIRYYASREQHDLPPPSLPAATTYPWPWHERIDQARAALLQVVQVATADAATNDSTSFNGTESVDAEKLRNRRSLRADDRDDEPRCGTDDRDSKCEEEVMKLMAQLINEFHFTTGIPRLGFVKDHFTPLVFPSNNQFLHACFSTNSSNSASFEGVVDADAEAGVSDSRFDRLNGTNSTIDNYYAERDGVYGAAKQFYSYVTVEKDFVLSKDTFTLKTEAPTLTPGASVIVESPRTTPPQAPFANCSVPAPCTARSGVTVFTPALAMAVHEIYQNTTHGAGERERTKRQEWLKHIARDGFDAEKRVLETGLVAPSTAWYSYYDVDADMLGDEVLGLANATKAQLLAAGELMPSKLYDVLMVDSKSPLQFGSSYYVSTNSRTRRAMHLKRSNPTVTPFGDDDLIDLIGVLFTLMGDLEAAVQQYVHKRDADPVHIAMVNATEAEVLYDGRLYGLLGFGYHLPASNKLNVAYVDHKLPEPFHLVMRLLIRLQESHLVLPEESRRIVACLAMLRFDVKYYKCVRVSDVDRPSNSPAVHASARTAIDGAPSPLTPRDPVPTGGALEW